MYYIELWSSEIAKYYISPRSTHVRSDCIIKKSNNKVFEETLYSCFQGTIKQGCSNEFILVIFNNRILVGSYLKNEYYNKDILFVKI